LAGTKVAKPRAIAAADGNPLRVSRKAVMDVPFSGLWAERVLAVRAMKASGSVKRIGVLLYKPVAVRRSLSEIHGTP
jgi:hypothetical protein